MGLGGLFGGFLYWSSVAGEKGILRGRIPGQTMERCAPSWKASLPRGREGAAAAAEGTGQAATAAAVEGAAARGGGGHLGASSGTKARGREESFSYSSGFRTPSGCFRKSLRS